MYLNEFLFCCDLAFLHGRRLNTGDDSERRDALDATVCEINDTKIHFFDFAQIAKRLEVGQ